MRLSTYLENQRQKALDRLASLIPQEGIEAYRQWIEDDAGCDLEVFIVSAIGEPDAIRHDAVWDLQYAHEAIWKYEQLEELANIARAIKTLKAALL